MRGERRETEESVRARERHNPLTQLTQSIDQFHINTADQQIRINQVIEQKKISIWNIGILEVLLGEGPTAPLAEKYIFACHNLRDKFIHFIYNYYYYKHYYY